LIKRIFAWMISRNVDDENSNARKRSLFKNLHGSVLEIGPGTGANLEYFPSDVEWVGVEPNPHMVPYLEKTYQSLRRPLSVFRIETGDGERIRLPAGNEQVDAVVSTHVLCSVPDQQKSLQEVLRVLKPGGRFVFIEHVAAPRGSRQRWWQDKIQPLWTVLGDGCHPNRETWEAIAQAGFVQVQLEHYRYAGGGLVEPHIAGTALKRG
jgi:SAM-dependent methyltransferase